MLFPLRLANFLTHDGRSGRAERGQGCGEEYLPRRPLQRQQGAAERRPDDGAYATDARRPPHARGANRGRVEIGGETVESGLSAADTAAQGECQEKRQPERVA